MDTSLQMNPQISAFKTLDQFIGIWVKVRSVNEKE